MKEKIIKVVNDWFIEIAEIKETEKTINVIINRFFILTSKEIQVLQEETNKTFFIEYRNGNLQLTWYK